MEGREDGKDELKTEDTDRSQTAGGWWKAPAAIPTSFFFFYLFLLPLPLCISVPINT